MTDVLAPRSEMAACHEECGVVGILGVPDAAVSAYLALHALQHRGQESAGIAACDGAQIRVSKAMGHVNDVFNDEVIAKLPGTMAIGSCSASRSRAFAAARSRIFS